MTNITIFVEPEIKPLSEKERRERRHAKEQWRRYVLPELRLPLREKAAIDEVEERVDGRPKPFAVSRANSYS